jgi:GntR family transcriptional regulator, transcriptional repressor for pyruvate dehydrogenase complex
VAVTDEAIEKIKAMILSGELRPGDRLPVEKTLAQRLGLSRNSLREAIRALSVLRVLETKQGAGTFVTSLAPGLVLEAVSFIVNFHDPHTAIHFLDVRRVLESEATARACARLRPEEIEELRALNAQIRAIAATVPIDAVRLVDIDRQFHSRITAAAGNPALAALTDMLGGQTAPVRSLRLVVHESTAASAVAEHEEIIAALAVGDVERARLRAAVHVLNLEDWLLREVGSPRAPSPGAR